MAYNAIPCLSGAYIPDHALKDQFGRNLDVLKAVDECFILRDEVIARKTGAREEILRGAVWRA